MGYRDDREAMRQRVGMLEGDLERTRAELDRLQVELARHASKDVDDEAEKERLEREVATLRRRLGETAPDPERARRHLPFAVGAASLAALLVGVVAALSAAREDGTGAPAARAVAELPTPPEPAPAPEEAAPSKPTASEPGGPIAAATAVFGAVVEDAEGIDLRPGDGCLLYAHLSAGPEVEGVRVSCADRVLYDSALPLGGGFEMSASTVVELPAGPQGELVYVLRYQDEGMRSGPRGELVADSIAQSARVRASGSSPAAVVLRLAHLSAPRQGPSLGPARFPLTGSDERRTILAGATPSRRDGPAPEPPAGDCELRVQPLHEGGTHDCRVVLRCGASVIYGAGTTGFNDCAFEAGWPAHAVDDGSASEDGDPRMRLDWGERLVEVGDDRGAESWRMTFRLGPLPRGALVGSWDGTAWGEDGEETRLSLTVPRRGHATLQRRDAEGHAREEVEVRLEREGGEVTAGPLRGILGPGGATLIGAFTAGTGEARPFALTRRRDG